MRRAMLEALEKKYEAEISAADITINIYLNNSVGIGEHPQHLEEIDKQVQIIADAQEKIKVLKSFEPERSVL
jgi:small nuclear ribonucleoprotein (snRNP)-like protein